MEFFFTYNPRGYVGPLVPLVMLAWLGIVLYIFSRFPAQWAVVISFITAWLFLPEASLSLTGIPDYTKMSATCYGILVATLIFDPQRFRSFRLGWLDLPMLVWCLCPYASSITNDLGWYDGLSAALNQTVIWGFPYFLGRIYLNNLVGIRKLAIGIVIGGLLYIPLCLYEIVMSPQLHRLFYGSHAFGGFLQSIRYGGFRPTVFMRHGLSVSVWMMTATLLCIWLWQTGVIRLFWNVPVSWLIPVFLVTFVLCKSTGAILLFLLGIGILFVAWQFRTAIPLLVLIVSMGVYLSQNSLTETYVTDQIAQSLSGIVPEERIQSLEFRFNNEELLADKARERIVFGWGGWGRNRVYDEEGNDITTVDSLWIMAFGMNGLVGLTSLMMSFFLPVIGFLSRYPASWWTNRQVAPAAALAVILILYALDCVVNAMINPILTLTCGGIAGLAMQFTATVRAKI